MSFRRVFWMGSSFGFVFLNRRESSTDEQENKLEQNIRQVYSVVSLKKKMKRKNSPSEYYTHLAYGTCTLYCMLIVWCIDSDNDIYTAEFFLKRLSGNILV